MSALDIYMTPIQSEPAYINLFYTIAASTTLLLLIYTVELYRQIITLHHRIEKSMEPRLLALEGVTKDLVATEVAHEDLLEEHGEEISLTSATAYAAAEYPLRMAACSPQPRFVSDVKQTTVYNDFLNIPIQDLLRSSPKKTAREIFVLLSQDLQVNMQWKRSVKSAMSRHDVNRSLYSLLAQGKLKKDNSARPVWSVA